MPKRGERIIKCVVWDLDNTLWPGIAAEGPPESLPDPDPAMLDAITRLEQRGILNSIASRNDPSLLRQVDENPALAGKFAAPQVSWGPKSESLQNIARSLNIGIDSLAFVDDSPFERAEVEHLAPGVLVLAPEELTKALDTPPFNPSSLTPEARKRAGMYHAEERRRDAEAGFSGNRTEFLHWCEMHLHIAPATGDDLPRIHEMTQRTHQLNSTGREYTEEQLAAMIADRCRLVPVARLTDRFGDYGLIGAALVDRNSKEQGSWLLELLMLSCRVEGRGIPAAMLRWIMDRAKAGGASSLRAVYRINERNLPIRLLFRQMGFSVVGETRADLVTVERNLSGDLPSYPEWLYISADGGE